jgi:hypothetical protein
LALAEEGADALVRVLGLQVFRLARVESVGFGERAHMADCIGVEMGGDVQRQ